MAIKSVLLGLICEERLPSEHVCLYAVELAARFTAQLAIAICVPKIEIAVVMPIAQIRGLVSGANAERHALAETASETYLGMARRAGLTASARLFHAPYPSARDQVNRLARVNDLTVLQRSLGALSLEKDLAEECLFNSGRPVIAVPPEQARAFSLRRIIIAWDGGARAARAVGDAMQFIAAAETVEIVCVAGDPRPDKQIHGGELAEHLARHCRNVTTSDLKAPGGDVAAALIAHAQSRDADLIVMGGFAHARFRQMLLGGVTQTMLSTSPVPLFLSY